MSDPDDLTPEEEQVRRLLADARHSAPLPDDVAARLDAVLADLRDEDPAAPVVVVAPRRPSDLAAARRRRHVRSWLVAAAAVVAVGIGVNQVTQMDVSGGDGDSSSSADGGAVAGDTVSRPANGEDAGGGSGAPSDQENRDPAATASGPELGNDFSQAPVRLHPDRFGTQVTRLRDQAGSVVTESGGTTDDGDGLSGHLFSYYSLDSLSRVDKSTCPTTSWGRGHALAVRYDGQPGALVFRPVRGDTQVVDLFLCGSDHAERSITLPAP